MPAAAHVVTLTPISETYLSSLPERTAPRYIGTPCRTQLQSHVGEKVTVTLELRTVNPTTLRVYPYQQNGITIAGSHYYPTTSAYQTIRFVDTVKDWGNNPAYSTGEIGIYDDSNAGGGVYVRNMTVTAGDSAPVDISCLIDEASIIHGREDTSSQPEASAATLDLSRDGLGEFGLPAGLEIGAGVVVKTTTGTQTTTTRFSGTVTDITLAWDDAGEDTPDAGVGQIICTGPLDATARQVVGDVPWPQELDGARVSRIMAAAGVNLNPATSDPGLVAVLARDVDSQAALDLAREIGDSSGGMMWETRDGDIRYADAAHRRNIASSLTFDSCDVLVTPSWRRTLDGLINSVSLGYGVAPDGGEQPRYLASNPTSINRFGTHDYSFTSQLATLADATAMGNLLMGRNAFPVWIMAALPIDVLGLDAARYDALLALDVHALITLTGLPVIGSAPTTATLWVEGWRETLAHGVHDIELVVSGYCRTAPPPRWDDVDPTWTWDTVGTLPWDSAYCLGPPVNYGRWNDVPASLRWDAVPANVTWDTYAAGFRGGVRSGDNG